MPPGVVAIDLCIKGRLVADFLVTQRDEGGPSTPPWTPTKCAMTGVRKFLVFGTCLVVGQTLMFAF